MLVVVLSFAGGIPLALAPLVYFGSVQVMQARLSGRPIAFDAPNETLQAVVGEPKSVRATVWNFTSQPVRVLGVKSSCGCLRAKVLPNELPVGRTHIDFELTPERAGEASFEIEVYLDVEGTKRFTRNIPVQIREQATTDGADIRPAGDMRES